MHVSEPVSSNAGRMRALRSLSLKAACVGLSASFTFALAGAPSRTQSAPLPPPTVGTLAGDGRAGFLEGDARPAQFMMPAALAAAGDGRIYIADAGAQRIRMLFNGQVTTLAGAGTENVGGLRIRGGYADGPALQARFNTPLGIAVDRGRDVYVADTYNHCIRRLHDGVVSTYAGAPDRPGKLDGGRSAASFQYPRALSFDTAGNLYVADYGVGIRKIAADGTVSTLELTDGGAKTYTSVSAVGSGAGLVVYAANTVALIVYRGATNTSTQTNSSRNPYFVFGLNDHEALVGDEAQNTIAMFRGSAKPLTGEIVYDLAGSPDTRDGSAGFRDGTPDEARFDTPTAIVRDRDGRLIVADSGNRRLRVLSGLGLRGPVGGIADVMSWPPNTYRIVFVSNSVAFWNTSWDASMPGRIERGLAADMGQTGLARTPRVEVARIDQASVSATKSYVTDLLAEAPVDLVVVVLNFYHVYAENNAVQLVAPALTAMDQRLSKAHARLLVVYQPSSEGVEPVSFVDPRLYGIGPAFDRDLMWETEQRFAEAVRTSGVDNLSLIPDFLEYEASASTTPLLSRTDGHLTSYGNEFVAQRIVKYLETERPWLHPR
jgi:hypothetical protein